MELYIDRDELSRGLARIQGIIERRSTHPLLSHVLLHARQDSLRMTATDTEVAFIGDLTANVQNSGEVAVDAAQLFQVVRSLPEATVHLKLVEGLRLEIRSGRAYFKLNGVGAEEYPTLPPFDLSGTARISESDLKRLVDQVSFAVATEDVRWGLNGAHLEKVDANGEVRLRMVATDGHRLALAEAPFEGDFAFSQRMLIPRKALSVLKKLLDSRGQEVEIDFGEGALQLRRPQQTFWFRLLDGNFPTEYASYIPSDNKHAATLKRTELASTLKRVGILVQDRARAVKFSFGSEDLEVQVRNVDRGEVTEAVSVDLVGEPITVGFNAKYLQDVLSVVSGDEVLLELAHPLAPCLVRDPSRDDASFVIMPMRLD